MCRLLAIVVAVGIAPILADERDLPIPPVAPADPVESSPWGMFLAMTVFVLVAIALGYVLQRGRTPTPDDD